MAGGYNDCVGDDGKLKLSGAPIENLSDAYVTIEEMFGMIWWLAMYKSDHPDLIPGASAADLVEQARTHYETGLLLAQQHAEPKRR